MEALAAGDDEADGEVADHPGHKHDRIEDRHQQQQGTVVHLLGAEGCQQELVDRLVADGFLLGGATEGGHLAAVHHCQSHLPSITVSPCGCQVLTSVSGRCVSSPFIAVQA